jgi:pimeloyl-ACP methyl ester carboxylesterase
VDDDRLRVCLERTVELWPVQLRLRDWPGFGGAPVVHAPDPLLASDEVIQALAGRLAPRCRVLSLEPRQGQPYQVAAADLLGVLDQFGFSEPVLVGEGLGCLSALLVATWHPDRVGRLVLIDPSDTAPVSEGLEARALRDCPPDWPSLREAVRCPLLTVDWSTSALASIERFLSS